MVTEDIPLGETGMGVPRTFETTKQRLGLNPVSGLKIKIDIRR